MFIRKQTHTRKDGSKKHGFALLEAYREKGKPKQNTLLNLGPDFDLPEEDWPDFTERIKLLLQGKRMLKFKDEAYQKKVEHVVQQIKESGYQIRHRKKERLTFIPEYTEHLEVREVGGERLALKALKDLRIEALLLELGFRPKDVKIAFVLIIGRMLHPGSERNTHDWMCNTSSILELLDLDPAPSLNALYRCDDLLYQHRHAITEGLFGATKEILGLDGTLVFYDLTNTFYYGEEKGELLRYGRSKEKRKDCPLVSMALTLDASGFPRGVEILPGNVSEPGTLKSALDKLDDTETPTVIMDAGISTEDNRALLKEKGLFWICVDRRRTSRPKGAPDLQFTSDSGAQIQAWILPAEEGEQQLYVHSDAREKLEKEILEKKIEAYRKSLMGVKEGLSIPKRMKNIDRVNAKVCRLAQAHSGVSHLFKVEVIPKEGNPKVAADIRITKRPAHEDKWRSVGGYVLSTNREDLEPETLIRTYWRLAEIEQAFRGMKSDFGLRPIYHQKDERIEAHMFISVLAYYATHLIRTKLKAHEIHDSWDTIRTHCNRIHRVTTKFYQSEERHILMKRDQNLSPSLEPVLEFMDVKYDPNDTMLVKRVHTPRHRDHDLEITALGDNIRLPSEPKKPPD